MAKKIIIGVHGLRNKPPRNVLARWWVQSISEGLRNIDSPHKRFEFELAYWSHYLHAKPLDPHIKDPKHPRYVRHPYVPGKAKPKIDFAPGKIRKAFLDLTEKVLDGLFLSSNSLINFDPIGDWIIRKKFVDLQRYYDDKSEEELELEERAKTLIRKDLAAVLHKHRRKDILLLTHSMGSIIAYDVLTRVTPKLKIHTFVTAGSPLGLPAVTKRIFVEQGLDYKKERKVPVPDNITEAWFNFADLRDRVTMNYDLADDYGKNKFGVAPQDHIVNNEYEYEGERNHHKSYGYLRTPELARVVRDFLDERKPSAFDNIKNWLGQILSDGERKAMEAPQPQNA